MSGLGHTLTLVLLYQSLALAAVTFSLARFCHLGVRRVSKGEVGMVVSEQTELGTGLDQRRVNPKAFLCLSPDWSLSSRQPENPADQEQPCKPCKKGTVWEITTDPASKSQACGTVSMIQAERAGSQGRWSFCTVTTRGQL